MQESQKEKLQSYTGTYISLGISCDGTSRGAISVPWVRDTNAYNMRLPDLWLSPEDLSDAPFMARLRQFRVQGCYLYTPLEDYTFLAQFPHMEDLHIAKGSALKDLSFMQNMPEWFHLYVEDADIGDLRPAFPEDWKKKGLHSYCVAFINCRVGDISPLLRNKVYLSELLVACPKGTNDKKRWSQVKAGTFRYWEF